MSGKKFIDLKENDFVEFYLYPNIPSSLPLFKNDLQAVETLKKQILSIVEKISEKYIWHNEGFKIYAKNLVSYEYSNNEGELILTIKCQILQNLSIYFFFFV